MKVKIPNFMPIVHSSIPSEMSKLMPVFLVDVSKIFESLSRSYFHLKFKFWTTNHWISLIKPTSQFFNQSILFNQTERKSNFKEEFVTNNEQLNAQNSLVHSIVIKRFFMLEIPNQNILDFFSFWNFQSNSI